MSEEGYWALIIRGGGEGGERKSNLTKIPKQLFVHTNHSLVLFLYFIFSVCFYIVSVVCVII